MSARRAGTGDGASESTGKSEDTNQGKEPQGGLLGSQKELLGIARSMGHVVGEHLPLEREASESEESDEGEEQTTDEAEETVEESETESEEGTQEEEGSESESEEEGRTEGEAETEEEDETEEGGHKSIDEQIKALKAAGKPVPWYFNRIQKLTKQRIERDGKIEKITATAQALYRENQQLKANPVAASVDQSDPLANCFTEQDLVGKQREAEKWLAWCEHNRNGGTAKIGDDEVELDSDQVIDLKLGCEKTLREGIPNRRQYIQNRLQMDAKAVEIYPELRDPTSVFRQESDDILRAFPILQKLPDVRIWIGHAIAGRNAYLAKANGKTKGKQSSTSRIVKSAKTKVAPTTAKTRGFVPRGSSVDKETARKDLQQKGDADSAEKYLEKLGVGGGRSTKFERVEA